MLFLRNKKHKKIMNVVWTVISLFIAVSMVLLYLPAFFQ
jgi:predicted nucleic acid-binding Zn ribbon protein